MPTISKEDDLILLVFCSPPPNFHRYLSGGSGVRHGNVCYEKKKKLEPTVACLHDTGHGARGSDYIISNLHTDTFRELVNPSDRSRNWALEI